MESILEIFRPVHPNYAGVFARLFCLVLIVQTVAVFGEQLRYFKSEPAKLYGKPPRLFGIFRLPLLDKFQFGAIGILFILSLICALVGFAPRVFLLVSLLSYFPYFNSIASLAYIQRKTNLVPFVLLILVVSPAMDLTINESSTIWEIVLVKIGIAQMYFSSGLQKLRNSGVSWFSGDSLRAYLSEHFLWNDQNLAFRIAQHRRLCQVLSTATIIFELTFWIIIFLPQLTLIYVVTAILFHLGTWFTMRINYLKYLSPVYMVFLAEIPFWFVNR